MSFGDWELMRMVIIALKDQELSNLEENSRSVRFTVGNEESSRRGMKF